MKIYRVASTGTAHLTDAVDPICGSRVGAGTVTWGDVTCKRCLKWVESRKAREASSDTADVLIAQEAALDMTLPTLSTSHEAGCPIAPAVTVPAAHIIIKAESTLTCGDCGHDDHATGDCPVIPERTPTDAEITPSGDRARCADCGETSPRLHAPIIPAWRNWMGAHLCLMGQRVAFIMVSSGERYEGTVTGSIVGEFGRVALRVRDDRGATWSPWEADTYRIETTYPADTAFPQGTCTAGHPVLLVPAIGNKVTYRDWRNDPESFLRVGIVTGVKEVADGHILTLRHPERPEVLWTEWLDSRMVVTSA